MLNILSNREECREIHEWILIGVLKKLQSSATSAGTGAVLVSSLNNVSYKNKQCKHPINKNSKIS